MLCDKQPGYGGAGGGAGGAQGQYAGEQDPLDALGESIPGEPGEDYPILANVPETSFGCEGQVEGGYYADPEGECQVFHICAGGGVGTWSGTASSAPMGHFSGLNMIQYFSFKHRLQDFLVGLKLNVAVT